MDTSDQTVPRRSLLGWFVDLILGLSLLAAVLSVHYSDRHRVPSVPDKVAESEPAVAPLPPSAPVAAPAVPESQPKNSKPAVPPPEVEEPSAEPEKNNRVDLVFILDQRPPMKDMVAGMAANCEELAESLAAGGQDCRFAVIPFGTNRNRIAAIPLTADLDDFKERLAIPPDDEEPVAAASSVEALEQALRLDFRKDAQVLFYVISKQPCESAEEIQEVAERMQKHSIAAIVQADATEIDRCQPLYRNGRFFSMEGADLTPEVVLTAKDRKSASRAGDIMAERATGIMAQLAPKASGLDASKLVKAKGIYAVRTAPDRQNQVVTLGGNQDSEDAVQDGLNWLARHQADDGHWSDQRKCERNDSCSSLQYTAEIAETGLAILAFQAGGNYYFNDQKYSDHVKKGLDWLVGHQGADGRLFGPQHTWYQHGIGTFALAEACAVALANDEVPEPRYRIAAERAIKFMEKHQYRQGGWQYSLDSQGIGDTSVTGWQILALKSALEAKIEVSSKTMDRVRKFFVTCGDPKTGRTGYMSRGLGTDLTTAVGLVVQEFIVKKPKSPFALKAAAALRKRAREGIGQTGDFYTLYNATLAMFLARGDAWDEWNDNVRDAIVKRQIKKGCERGSWYHNYSRTLDTAWAVLTLEVYYRYATDSTE